MLSYFGCCVFRSKDADPLPWGEEETSSKAGDCNTLATRVQNQHESQIGQGVGVGGVNQYAIVVTKHRSSPVQMIEVPRGISIKCTRALARTGSVSRAPLSKGENSVPGVSALKVQRFLIRCTTMIRIT